MAVLYVAEFNSIGGQGNFPVQAAEVPPIAEQTVAIGGSSAACTNAFNKNTAFVRIEVDAVCSIAFCTAPTATTGNMRMAANTTEYFSVPAGANYKVAAITNS
jgi:hypothetical protein